MTEERITYQETPKEFYEVMLNTEQYIKECGIPHSLIELIKTRSSQINGCGYCIDMHHKNALKAGESFDRLYLLPDWEETPSYSAEEKAVLKLTEVLTKLHESDPAAVNQAYDTMAKHYTKEEIANIVLTICQINSWNRIAITFGNIPGSYEG